MNLALRVDPFKQGVVRVDAGIVGKRRARGDALNVQLRAALELALQVAAAALGQARQILVEIGKVDGHIGQRLAFDQDETCLRQLLGQRLGKHVVIGRKQRRMLRQVFDDGEHARTRTRPQLRSESLGAGLLREQGVLADRGAHKIRCQAQALRQPAATGQLLQLGFERVIGGGEQIKRCREGRRRPVAEHDKTFRRMHGKLPDQRGRFQLIAK